ncbi:MAG: zinc ribbon domain-containing protein [Thermoplasmata archaeon]|nr:zinc ribbon domain-containing protein [Thermoplasmata archaeon]
MPLTAPEGELIIFLLLLAVVLLAGLWYLRRRFAERRRQLSGEIAESVSRTEERAHNQIVLDEAELATLLREGFELERPKRLLDEARSALARKDYHHSLQIARSVHDFLVKLRQTGPGASDVGPDAGGRARAAPFGIADLTGVSTEPPMRDAGGAGAEPAPARPALPKNQLESRFQISLLTEELVEAVRVHPEGPPVVEANRLAAEASALAIREEYTEALRMALKARRILGGKLETLPTASDLHPFLVPPSSGGSANSPGPSRSDRLGTAVRPAPAGPRTGTVAGSGAECHRCHRPLRAGDSFCRSCGAPAVPPKCPRCGMPIESSDQFCARCGTPLG